MNKARRKEIENIVEKLEELQSDIESVLSDEQDYLDNIPENLQGSERYETAEMAVDELQSAYDTIEDVISALQNAAE